MNSLIIGKGEIGTALYGVLSKHYVCDTYDIKDKIEPRITNDFKIMHICFPYCKNFVDKVEAYIMRFTPLYTVIHSTVPVGTCKKFKCNIFHSPVRGVHPNIEDGLLTYIKYISTNDLLLDNLSIVTEYFEKAGIVTKLYYNTDETELMKLLSLARYGVYLAFAKEQEDICNKFGLEYHKIVGDCETTRNEGMKKLGHLELCQPVLYPFTDYVGGHCVVENMAALLGQYKTPMLQEAFEIDSGIKIWDNCNIYDTAQIGKGVSIGAGTEIGHEVKIGNGVRIGAQCFIPEGVTIEKDCFIAPGVKFSNDKHPPSNKKKWGKVLVKEGATIGMGAIILPGVVIGKKAMIGAGAVVTKDVPDNEVWYGVPAYSHGITYFTCSTNSNKEDFNINDSSDMAGDVFL